MTRVGRTVVGLTLLAELWPGSVSAQLTKAGVVTTLEGNVTAARSTAIQPVALKFKDDVFVNDRVVTGERALARLLLGGKAVVTVRERSALTITEVPGRSTVDLDSGKIAVAVAKDKMQPGEQIEIKTPNAVAAVRGTVFVVEVIRASASANNAQAGVTVNHYVFVGEVAVTVGAQVITVGPNSFASVTGGVVNSGIMSPAMRANAAGGFAPSGLPKVSGAESDAKQTVMDSTIATFTAATLPVVTPTSVQANTPPAPIPTPFPGSNTSGPTAEDKNTIESSTGAGTGSGAVVITGQNLVLAADQTLKTFSGQSSSSSADPAVAVTNSTVSGPNNLIVVAPGANASLTGPLLAANGSAATPTSLTANQAIVDVRGVISSTTTGAFINADPTFFNAPNFLSVTGGSLSLAGPLLTDAGGVYSITGDFLSVPQGGSLTASSSSPLLNFSGSAVAIGVSGSQTQSHLLNLEGVDSAANLGGSLASLTNSSVMVVNGAPGSALVAIAPGATLTSSSTSPLVSLNSSLLGLGAGVRGLLGTGGTASIGGPLLAASAGSVIAGDLTVPLVDLSGTSLTMPGTLIQLQGGSTLVSGGVKVTNGSLTADSLVSTDGAGNTILVNGPVLDLSNATVTLRKLDDRPSGNTDNAVLLLNLNQPAVSLASSQLTLTGGSGPVITLDQANGAVVTNPGVAIVATGTANAPSSISLSRSLIGVGPVSLTATQPLLQLNETTINQAAVGQTTNDLILVTDTPGSGITSAGQLLSATNSIINAGGGSLVDFVGSTLTSGTSSPFLFFDPSTVTTAQNLMKVQGGSSLSFAGPLLSAQGTTFTISDPATFSYGLLSILDGSSVTSGGTAALLAFDAASVDSGTLVSVRRSPSALTPTTLTLSGPLFSAVNGSTFHLSRLGLGATVGTSGGPCCALLSVQQGGQLSSTTTDPLIQLTNSIVNDGPDARGGGSIVSVANTFTGAPAAELVAPANVTLSGPLLSASAGSISAMFNLLNINQSNFSSSSANPLIQLGGTRVTLGGLDPVSGAPDAGRVLSLSASAATPASLILQGPLFTATNATLSGTDTLFGVFNGSTLTSTTASPLISFTGGSAASGVDSLSGLSGNFISVSSGSLHLPPAVTLAGPLLSSTNAVLGSGDPTQNTFSFLFIGDGAHVTSTTGAPFLSFDGSSVTTSGGVLSLRRSLPGTPSTLTLAGPLFSAIDGSSFSVTSLGFGQSFGTTSRSCCTGFFVSQGAQLIGTSGLPLIQLANSTFNAGPDARSGGTFFNVTNTFGGAPAAELVAPATVTLSGPLLSATGGSLSALFNLLDINQSNFASSSQDPLIQLNGTTVTLGGVDPISGASDVGRILSLGASAAIPASLTLKGPLFAATNASVSGTDSLFAIFNGSTLTSSTASPLISFNGGSAAAGVGALAGLGGNIIVIASGTLHLPPTVTLAGPLLSAINNATLSSGSFSVFFIGDGAHVTSSSVATFLAFDASRVTSAGAIMSLNRSVSLAMPSKLTLAGPLFSAVNGSSFDCCGGFHISQGAQLISTTTDPLIQLANSSFKVGPASDFFFVADTFSTAAAGTLVAPASVTLSGPLLSITGGSLSVAQFNLLDIQRSNFISNSQAPLIQLNGTTVTLGGSALFVSGTSTALDAQSGLTLGTDRPLQGPQQQDGTRPVPGSLLQTTGATVTGQRLLNVDTALLEATAPLLNAINGSALTTALDAINLANRGNVLTSSATDLLSLNASQLIVNSGALVNVNASKLTVGGNLVTLANGATLNLLNGALITVRNGGYVNIMGSLINFTGTSGSQVNVTNNFCAGSCQSIGGIPVALQNGAVAGNVQITNPINNSALGKVTLSPNAALAVVNGAGSKLTVGRSF